MYEYEGTFLNTKYKTQRPGTRASSTLSTMATTQSPSQAWSLSAPSREWLTAMWRPGTTRSTPSSSSRWFLFFFFLGLHLHRLQDGRHHRHPDPGEHGEPRRGRWRPDGWNAQVSIQSPHLLVANYQLKPGQKYILWILLRLPISCEKEHVPNKRARIRFVSDAINCFFVLEH